MKVNDSKRVQLYKIKFRISVYCCGIVSSTEGHTSVLAHSEEEAKNKVRENIRLTYLGTTDIQKVEGV